MSKITVDIQGLRENSDTLSNCVAEMENLYRRLNTLISQLDATWDGDASQAYISKLNRQANLVMDSAKITKEFSEYGKKTADKFEAIDAANKILESVFPSIANNHSKGRGGRSL